MKGKIRAIIITMVLLLAGTGAFLWKMNDLAKKAEEKEDALLKQERDLVEEQKGKVIDKIKQVDIIPLYLSGDKKNVVTSDFHSVDEVYTTAKSASVEENLTTIKRNRAYTSAEPLWSYNPYGTNRNSMYLYFKTQGNCYVRYTISVKDPTIPDFTRTAYTGGPSVTKEHEYQITGLIEGQTNYIVLNLYNSDDKLSETKVFSVELPQSPTGALEKLTIHKGTSKNTISNGLYVVFQKEKEQTVKQGGKKYTRKTGAILLYDNSGILRGEIPTGSQVGRNMEQIYDTQAYSVGKDKIVQVNPLGQVTKVHELSGYSQSGEFTYDGSGSIYVIATANQKKATPKSKILRVSVESSVREEVVDMDELLSSVYKKEVKKQGKKNVDWIGLNSVQVVGTNQLLLSSKKLSSIFKVSNIGSLMTKVNYIIGDKRRYKAYPKLKKKVFTKVAEEKSDSDAEPTATPRPNILKKPVQLDAFVSQIGQETLLYKKKSGEGLYNLSIFTASAGHNLKADGNSYYMTFAVDETAKSYQLKTKSKLPQTKNDGNYKIDGNQYIYCCSDKGYFTESDTTGRTLRDFRTERRPYRVYKNDFKGFLFR